MGEKTTGMRTREDIEQMQDGDRAWDPKKGGEKGVETKRF